MTDRKTLAERIMSCRNCELSSRPYTGPVPFSVGENYHPRGCAILAEAPGAHEVAQGKPLVGPSGRKLNTWLRDVGLDPEAFCRLNVVCCNPVGTPSRLHVSACRQNFVDQLTVLDPAFVLVVGKVAFEQFWALPLSTARGHIWEDGDRWMMATWHPSYALRTEGVDAQARRDLRIFADLLRGVFSDDTCAMCGTKDQVRRVFRGLKLCGGCRTPEMIVEQYFPGTIVL